MARTSTTALPNNPAYAVSSTVWNGLVGDYVSQSDTNPQNIASTLNFAAGKQIKFNGLPLRFPSKFSVTRVGGYYHVQEDDCVSVVSYSSFAQAMNDEAFNGLANVPGVPEKVLTNGDMTIDDTILLTSNLILEAYGRWTAVNSLNKNLIEQTGTAIYNTEICGDLLIDGNSANQYALSRGISLTCSTPHGYTGGGNVARYQSIRLKNVTVAQTRDTAIYAFFSGSDDSTIKLVDCSGTPTPNGTSYGLHLGGLNDSEVVGGNFGGDLALYIEGCALVKYSHMYVNQISQILGGKENQFSNCNFELGIDADLLLINGSGWNKFSNCNFRALSNGATTYDGVKITDYGYNYSIGNQFSTCSFGRAGDTGTRRFKYGIEEVSANQDYNIYSNIVGDDCVLGALRQLGINGKPRTNPADSITGTVVLV